MLLFLSLGASPHLCPQSHRSRTEERWWSSTPPPTTFSVQLEWGGEEGDLLS